MATGEKCVSQGEGMKYSMGGVNEAWNKEHHRQSPREWKLADSASYLLSIHVYQIYYYIVQVCL